ARGVCALPQPECSRRPSRPQYGDQLRRRPEPASAGDLARLGTADLLLGRTLGINRASGRYLSLLRRLRLKPAHVKPIASKASVMGSATPLVTCSNVAKEIENSYAR